MLIFYDKAHFLCVVKPRVELSDDQFLIGYKSNNISITFKVEDAFPDVETDNITWYYKNSSTLNTFNISTFTRISRNSTRHKFSNNGRTLTILNIIQSFSYMEQSDKGIYLMEATNTAGSDFNYTQLDVYGMSIFLSIILFLVRS